MMIRVCASVLVAALILAGTPAVVSDQIEYGLQQIDTSAQVQTDNITASPGAEETVPVLLTADEAKAIALAHAGLTADQVTRLKAEYDVDHGVKEYEVEFRSGDYEFEYTIHAETGEILKNHKEYDPVKTTPAPTEPAVTEPPATEPAPTLLTADEAKAIALAHAGLTADQVTRLKAEYDVDHGVKEYEVEFRSGSIEYEYEINAETGVILSWDKDLDD